jgi:hypothetical protein
LKSILHISTFSRISILLGSGLSRLGMEIKIYPKKNKKKEEKEFVLLKT